MSEELKPCPYCGGHIGMTKSLYGGENWQITCGICLTSGPVVGTLLAAIAAWNSLKRDDWPEGAGL
jgi:hypothetical protein